MPAWDTLTQPGFLLGIIAVLVVGEGALFILTFRALRAANLVTRRQNTLFKGKEAKSLEAVILKQAEDISGMDKEIQELFEISNRIHQLAQKSIHRVGMLRFNPFKETGGNQSFSIALLDGKNNGAVLSSLHTREGGRVYAKPVALGQSTVFPLTEEEKQAIVLAQESKFHQS